MSDEEVESFEITDFDLDNEFNMNRRRRKMTKNDMIYGIWNDEESSGEENAPRRAAFSGGKKTKNYTAPIGFVAGGVQQAGKKKEEKKDAESDESDSNTRIKSKKSEFLGDNTSSDSDDEGPSTSQFRHKSHDLEMTGDIAGMRKKRPVVNQSLMKKGVGNWEKHTKGIGAKLLLQMGYEPGKGLGKTLQGINAPIEAKLRKGRGAIGAYGPEVAAKIADTITPDDKVERKEFTEKLSRWRKDDSVSNKRVKYIYKSIDDVIEQGKNKKIVKDTSALSKVKVIDMTGPQQRVLSGYHAISGQQRPSDEWEARKDKKFVNFAVPELLHNLNLLVDRCEQDIIQNDRKYRYNSDRIAALEVEAQNLDKQCGAKQNEIEQLEKLVEVIDSLIIHSSDGQLEKAADKFKQLKENYPDEYKLYEMSEVATTLIIPMVKQRLETWDALAQPSQHVSLFRHWRTILQSEHTFTVSNVTTPDPYAKLLWHAWTPAMRVAVSNWNCRKPEPMIELVSTWMPLLQPWVLDNILEELILSRLTLHVNEWDPMTDTIPIHAWIHPWIPLLGPRLETVVYPMIRHKLSMALTAWHPSDRSAKLMLLPWAKAFGKGEMNAFLIKNILPKLSNVLNEFIINPKHQALDEHWKWVMEWEELLPVASLATILEKHFFPKWLQVLVFWLNHSPNYEEVSSWYMGWKGLFSENLLKQPVIKDQFRKALDLMNRSVGQAPGAKESVSYLKTVERETPADVSSLSRYQALSEAVRTSSSTSVSSYKSLFMKKCEERGILMVPLNNKYYEGKQIYRCGNAQVYLDKNVIFVNQNGSWVPQSMSFVLDYANK